MNLIVIKNTCVDYSKTVNLFTELDAYPLPRIETLINKLAGYWIFSTFDLKSANYQLPLCEDKAFTGFEVNGRLYPFTWLLFGVTNGVATFMQAIDKFVDKEKFTNMFVYLNNITVAKRGQAEFNKWIKRLLEATQHQKLTLNDSKSILSANKISELGYETSDGLAQLEKSRLQLLLDLEMPAKKTLLKWVLGTFAYYAK